MKPPDLFDRDTEWAALLDFSASLGSGLRLGVVRGRRRQGKSYLLRRLAHERRGFYYQALEQERTPTFADLGRALGTYFDVPGGRVPVDSWDDVLALLLRPTGTGAPQLVVLDEFPYLLRHSPELPSLLQRLIDSHVDGPPVRLVLCGSALSIMGDLLSGARALRGRAELDLVVRPFDFRTSTQFWEIDDALVALHVHAVLGGTPGYRDLLSGRTPVDMEEFADWLARGVLNPANALFREDEYLLTEERTLSDRSLYHSVIASVAAGRSSQAGIASTLGRDQRSVQYALRALEVTGFLTRTDDALRDRRPIYRLADPIVAFQHAVTRPHLARLEDQRALAVWRDAEPRFRQSILGPHFEELARQHVRLRWRDPHHEAAVTSVGPALLNDRSGRSTHQIDLVAHGEAGDGVRRVVALGEAKATVTPMGLQELRRLEMIRELLTGRRDVTTPPRLLLFTAYGFTAELEEAVRGRADVDLLTLDALYR